MDLRTYLYQKRIKIAAFARKIDFSQVHIYKIVQRDRLPSKKLARIISKETNGEVSIEELMKSLDIY